jgi:hypothetical protein
VQHEHGERRCQREDQHRPRLGEQQRRDRSEIAATIDDTDAYRVSAKTTSQTGGCRPCSRRR